MPWALSIPACPCLLCQTAGFLPPLTENTVCSQLCRHRSRRSCLSIKKDPLSMRREIDMSAVSYNACYLFRTLGSRSSPVTQLTAGTDTQDGPLCVLCGTPGVPRTRHKPIWRPGYCFAMFICAPRVSYLLPSSMKQQAHLLVCKPGKDADPTQFLTPTAFSVKAMTSQLPLLPSLIPSPSPESLQSPPPTWEVVGGRQWWLG